MSPERCPTAPKDPYAVELREVASGRGKGRIARYGLDTGKRHELTQTKAGLYAAMQQYLAVRRALGFKLRQHEGLLRDFAQFMGGVGGLGRGEHQADDTTALTVGGVVDNERRNRFLSPSRHPRTAGASVGAPGVPTAKTVGEP